MDTPHSLQRFLDAQDRDYKTALEELKHGRKQSHWIWYIFPQVAGLGHSSMAQRYAITSRAEAQAYLDHPVLGRRLEECCRALLPHQDKQIKDIMGFPDDLKLRSSMTLFARISEEPSVFQEILDAFYAGETCARTIEFLDSNS